ncbi:MAG: hypothetical protein JSR80_02860 [Verrucomicrobia bacterium]|nr:hypothetical protein [Verrucomicrobiota bacterium]
MREFFGHLFIRNWPRKLIALLAAIVIWFLVSHSITVTRTITNVPVRVLNIPKDKTIEGLLPSGILAQRITLTLTGRKTSLDELSGNDFEVVSDAAGLGDHWTFEVSKRHLLSLNPDFDLARDVLSVAPVKITLQLEPLVTEKIPITLTEPIGDPPNGYIFLDVWPQRLYQTMSGAQRKIEQLKEEGLRLTLNLSRVSQADLEGAESRGEDGGEVRFFVPQSWKRITLPFGEEEMVNINDPQAIYLHLDFLKQELIPLNADIPIGVFYPLNFSLSLNPDTYTLEADQLIGNRNGVAIFNVPLYVRNVSRLFLNTVRDRLQLTIVATPKELAKELPWSVEFIDSNRLENLYVQAALQATDSNGAEEELRRQLTTDSLRVRFRKYIRDFELLHKDQSPLKLRAELGKNTITLTDASLKEEVK